MSIASGPYKFPTSQCPYIFEYLTPNYVFYRHFNFIMGSISGNFVGLNQQLKYVYYNQVFCKLRNPFKYGLLSNGKYSVFIYVLIN